MFVVLLGIACQNSIQKQSDASDTAESDIEYVSPPAVTEQRSMNHQDLERSYWLHIPENLPEAAPLMVVMHGYSDGAESMMDWSGLNALADEHGFVVVYPQGTRDDYNMAFFNVGYDFHSNETVDDLDFIQVLISELQNEFQLSTEHVFATGLSNGGDMSYYLACEASDVIRAIAPVAGTMMTHIYESCTPNRPVPVFELHGTEDDVTLWNGDPSNEGGWGSYLDTPSIIQFWVDHNALEEMTSSQLEDSAPGDGSRVRFERYYSNSSSTEVWLYAVEGGGHDWPGVWGNMDIDSNTEIWRFFEQQMRE